MLELDFYCTAPIDFEYQNYKLLNYLSEIDKSFSIHYLSPYLLHTEKLIIELDRFRFITSNFKASLRKDFIGFSEKGLIYADIATPAELSEIFEIVDYSKPLLQSKLKIGYKLFDKYPQLLY